METGCWEDPGTRDQESVCLRDGSLQLPSSSDVIQAPQEHQVLKVFQSVKKKKERKIQLVSSKGASERISWKEAAELSICYLYFDIQVPSVWFGLNQNKIHRYFLCCLFGLIQEFNIHFSPPSQHKKIEVGARRES